MKPKIESIVARIGFTFVMLLASCSMRLATMNDSRDGKIGVRLGGAVIGGAGPTDISESPPFHQKVERYQAKTPIDKAVRSRIAALVGRHAPKHYECTWISILKINPWGGMYYVYGSGPELSDQVYFFILDRDLKIIRSWKEWPEQVDPLVDSDLGIKANKAESSH